MVGGAVDAATDRPFVSGANLGKSGSWSTGDFNYDSSLQPDWSPKFIGNVLQHAVLPAATIVITAVGGWVLTMRNNMITTLAEDYVRMGRAKGLSNRRIMLDYAARNAMLPNLGVKIRENPGPGEYRYLRFAWKKAQGNAICLQLAHDGKFGPGST